MSIELKRTHRVSLPTGILDFALHDNNSLVYAACMDGIYAVDLPEPVPEKQEPEKQEKDKAEQAKSEPPKPKPRLIGRHDSYVSGVALRSKNSVLLSTGFDGMLQLRKLPEGELPMEDQPIEPHHRSRIHDFWSWAMSLPADEKIIASVTGQYIAGSEAYDPAVSAEPTVKLLDAESGQLLHALQMLPSVQCVAFDASSQYVAAANLMGDIAVWSVSSGECLASWRTKDFTSWGIIKSHCYIGGIFAIAFAPDGETLLVAGMGDMRDPMAGNGKQLWHRYAWRESPTKPLQTIDMSEAGEGLMEVLAWHPNGKVFLMAGRLRGGNWNLGVFDATSGRLVGQAKTGMRITSARFNSDGSLLTLAGMQGQPKPKEGRFPDFGYIERYTFS